MEYQHSPKFYVQHFNKYKCHKLWVYLSQRVVPSFVYPRIPRYSLLQGQRTGNKIVPVRGYGCTEPLHSGFIVWNMEEMEECIHF